MVTIIIDGNNLIHKVPHLKNLFLTDKESAVLSLVESVKTRLLKDEKAIFVFDGYGDIKIKGVIFSNEVTADEVIRKQIEDFTDHRNLKVVSSDNTITNLARVCGCAVRRSEDFWAELHRQGSPAAGKNINQLFMYDDLEKPRRMSRREIDEFKKYFG